MKKKGIIIICVAVIIGILSTVIFFFRTEISTFFADYSKNFKKNISVITELLDIKLPESCQNYLESEETEEIPLSEYKKHSDAFNEDLYSEISLETCVKKRISKGSTGYGSVDEQILFVEEKLR